jgi:predicted NAD/FAD-binding protein
VQGEGGIWLAGAWTGYGFHEDGLKSALRVANGLGVMAPWQGAAAMDQAA